MIASSSHNSFSFSLIIYYSHNFISRRPYTHSQRSFWAIFYEPNFFIPLLSTCLRRYTLTQFLLYFYPEIIFNFFHFLIDALPGHIMLAIWFSTELKKKVFLIAIFMHSANCFIDFLYCELLVYVESCLTNFHVQLCAV